MTRVYEGNRSPLTTEIRLRLAVFLWFKKKQDVEPRRPCHDHQWYGRRFGRVTGYNQFDVATKLPHTVNGKKYFQVEESVGINTGGSEEGKIITSEHHYRRARRVISCVRNSGGNEHHVCSRSNKRSRDRNSVKENPPKQGRFSPERIGSTHGQGDRTRVAGSTEVDKSTHGDHSGGDKKIKEIEGKVEEMGGSKAAPTSKARKAATTAKINTRATATKAGLPKASS